MNRIFRYLVFCLLLSCGIALAAPDKPFDDRVKVSAVDVKKGTIDLTHTTVTNHITTSYVMAPDATIEINGKSATLKDVKVGLHLHLLSLGSGMDDPPVIQDLDLQN